MKAILPVGSHSSLALRRMLVEAAADRQPVQANSTVIGLYE